MNVCINLPVADLARTRGFFETLGFAFDDTFADETALAMTVNDQANVMLLTRARFSGFTPRPVADGATTEVLVALQLASREAVDRMTDTAIANGGGFVREAEDHGFMYGRAFADPDGHIWEPFFMEEGKADG